MQTILDGKPYPHTLTKVVCVGRNYAAHAAELGNAIPDRPLLFIKPASAVVDVHQPIAIPQGLEACHHELEIAVLVGEPLTRASAEDARAAVAGVGLGLDLTLRDLQSELKAAGHPWERAKAFDGSCPLSEFVSLADRRLSALHFELMRNDELQQRGDSGLMLFSIVDLLVEISHSFSLLPGDVVLTGTPEGVGPLCSGDHLQLRLMGESPIDTRVL